MSAECKTLAAGCQSRLERTYDDTMVIDPVRLLAGLCVAGSGMWLGGLLTVPILALTSARLIDPATRTALFVAFGRGFAVLMGVVLAVVIVAASRLDVMSDDPMATGVLALSLTLLATTSVGVLQARRMSRLRRSVARDGSADGDQDVHRNATVALALRTTIGLISVAQLVMAVVLVGNG
mgnify:CR=1 FL=1